LNRFVSGIPSLSDRLKRDNLVLCRLTIIPL
jgi:hypothetical protein